MGSLLRGPRGVTRSLHRVQLKMGEASHEYKDGHADSRQGKGCEEPTQTRVLHTCSATDDDSRQSPFDLMHVEHSKGTFAGILFVRNTILITKCYHDALGICVLRNEA